MEEKFQKIKETVERELNLEKDSAHDIDHVMRVYNLALSISKSEGNVDLDVLCAATLLHDIGGAKEANDSSGKTDHAVVGAEMSRSILGRLGFTFDKIKHIQDCILSHRYRTDYKPETIEAKILFDADKLDAIGAIGAARVFSWIGKHNAKIYKKVNVDEYIKENQGGKIDGRIKDKSKHSAQINYEVKEKFLLDKLYTETAKKIGQERLAYYKNFLDRLEKEVNGEL
ncbi:phosphohydrolase [Candidatus Falkowbacteria bacterium HGW-Falkowbacteria-1]|jgi:uncharacterized protein|uniref:Phosphohydrolase n=1 Tax=Candidatus Falkowbacteria bacterium HGW-Falkowbacteria-1 TaxID=2013768 RepID=A0A2N2EAI2_9BACT|nr:MAG: phosphohydrolase [Candidatus Falkowbacteria bacterium HGW-Falkowbacteria-1]